MNLRFVVNEISALSNKITVKPYAPNIGGIVTGVDLSKDISEMTFSYHIFWGTKVPTPSSRT